MARSSSSEGRGNCRCHGCSPLSKLDSARLAKDNGGRVSLDSASHSPNSFTADDHGMRPGIHCGVMADLGDIRWRSDTLWHPALSPAWIGVGGQPLSWMQDVHCYPVLPSRSDAKIADSPGAGRPAVRGASGEQDEQGRRELD